MPLGQLEQFACDGCGKSYRWKAELAGKRVKCKCGTGMTVPQPPAPAESDDPFADALSAMAEVEASARVERDSPRCPSCTSEMPHGAMLCTQCGFNVNTGKIAGKKNKKTAQPVGMGVGGADGGGFSLPPPAVRPLAAPAGGMLSYAGMPVRRPTARNTANAGDNNIGHLGKDLILPIALFLIGVVLTFCEARFGRGINDVGVAMMFTCFTVVINLVLVFAAIMLAVQLLSLGLGPIGPALLKIAVVAVLPGAVSGLLWHIGGLGGIAAVYIVSLLLTYTLFMGLLGLDAAETRICTGIIWAMRTWVSYAIVAALLSGLGHGLVTPGSKSGAAVSSYASPSSGKLKSPKPQPKFTAAQLDAQSTAALAQFGAMEAKDWIKSGPPGEAREICRFGDGTAQQAIDGLYTLGASHVTVTGTKRGNDKALIVNQLVFTLPADKGSRLSAFWYGRAITKEFTGASQPDLGQKYLLVDFGAKPGEFGDSSEEDDQDAGN